MPVAYLADDSRLIRAQVPGDLPEFSWVTFDDGLALAKGLRSVTPDVVVVDVSLPELDGFDLLRDGHIAPHLPVVAISGKKGYLTDLTLMRGKLWRRDRFATVFKDAEFSKSLRVALEMVLGSVVPAHKHAARHPLQRHDHNVLTRCGARVPSTAITADETLVADCCQMAQGTRIIADTLVTQ